MNLAVFDLDGTLTQHVGADEECFIQAFADAYAINELDRNWMDYEHVTDFWVVTQVFKAKYGRVPKGAEIQRYVERYLSLLAEHSRVTQDFVRQIPGAQAFLSSLSEVTGWWSAIATGGWQDVARFKMMAAGMTTDHIPAAFAEDGPTREGIVRSAISRACFCYGRDTFERVVLVGDAVWDVRTARLLELPFVGVGHGHEADKLLAHGATHVIGDFLKAEHVLCCLEEAALPKAS